MRARVDALVWEVGIGVAGGVYRRAWGRSREWQG